MSLARRAFTEAFELTPELPEASDGLGRTELAEQRYGEALLQFDRAVELYRARAARNAGEQLETADELERLRRDFAAYGLNGGPCSGSVRLHHSLTPREVYADGSDPLPAGLRFHVGVCLLHLGQVHEARQALRTELERYPDSRAAHVNLAVCELALGDAPSALAEVQTARRLGAAVPAGLEEEIRSRLP